MANRHTKRYLTTNFKRNANQNHNKVSSHISQDGYAKQIHRYRKQTSGKQRGEGLGSDKLGVWD